jgi:hypothetical protein
MKEQGITPPPHKLAQIDAILGWMNMLWTAVDQVADHLVSSGAIQREYFDLANWEWANTSLFTPYRSRLKAMKWHSLATYLFHHCMLFQWNWETLPSKDIADLSFYGRPVEWLADGLVFGKVPRVKLGGSVECCAEYWVYQRYWETDLGSRWYTYEKWTP